MALTVSGNQPPSMSIISRAVPCLSSSCCLSVVHPPSSIFFHILGTSLSVRLSCRPLHVCTSWVQSFFTILCCHTSGSFHPKLLESFGLVKSFGLIIKSCPAQRNTDKESRPCEFSDISHSTHRFYVHAFNKCQQRKHMLKPECVSSFLSRCSNFIMDARWNICNSLRKDCNNTLLAASPPYVKLS